MLTIGVCDDEPVMLESFLERIRLFFSGEGLEIRTVPLFQRTGAAGLPGRAGCALPVLAAGCGLGVLPAPLPARVGGALGAAVPLGDPGHGHGGAGCPAGRAADGCGFPTGLNALSFLLAPALFARFPEEMGWVFPVAGEALAPSLL